jgi:membrane protease YdiL (CAAX protease family)
MSRSKTLPALLFGLLMALAYVVARVLALSERTGGHLPSTFVSFALLVAPIWFFGFGAAHWLRPRLRTPPARIATALLLVVPYFIFALPRHEFEPTMAAGFLAMVFGSAILLEWAGRQHGPSRGGWQDLIVLACLGLSVDLRWFQLASPHPAIGSLSKLLLVDLALYGYLVIRPLDGIGYDLRPTLDDVRIGLREFAFLSPLVIALGLALGFLHWHAAVPSPVKVAGAWLFTFLFIAIPEELFFRGLVQNLLERHMGARLGLAITSVLFGLSHFNKRLAAAAIGFNWRYVVLAAIAGLFYGRAWRARRRVLASAITHTCVDVTWSIWLR